MGMNYYKVIRALLGFKDRLSAFRTTKNAAVIKYFEEKEFDLMMKMLIRPTSKKLLHRQEPQGPRLAQYSRIYI
jgi:hypothetical protein